MSADIVGWDDNIVEKLGKNLEEGKYLLHDYFLSIYYGQSWLCNVDIIPAIMECII